MLAQQTAAAEAQKRKEREMLARQTAAAEAQKRKETEFLARQQQEDLARQIQDANSMFTFSEETSTAVAEKEYRRRAKEDEMRRKEQERLDEALARALMNDTESSSVFTSQTETTPEQLAQILRQIDQEEDRTRNTRNEQQERPLDQIEHLAKLSSIETEKRFIALLQNKVLQMRTSQDERTSETYRQSILDSLHKRLRVSNIQSQGELLPPGSVLLSERGFGRINRLIQAGVASS